MHAKLYISTQGAIVGSANASINGVGLVGRAAANLEAGVFFAPGTRGCQQATTFFSELWDRPAPALDRWQLDRAPDYAREPGGHIGPEGLAQKSVLGLVRSYPELFSDTLFFAEYESLTTEEEIIERGHYDEAQAGAAFQPARRSLIVRADHGYLPSVRTNALMFWHHKRRFSNIYAWTDMVSVRTDAHTTLWGIPNWRTFWRNHGKAAPDRRPDENDQQTIMSENGGIWCKTEREVGNMMAEAGSVSV